MRFTCPEMRALSHPSVYFRTGNTHRVVANFSIGALQKYHENLTIQEAAYLFDLGHVALGLHCDDGYHV